MFGSCHAAATCCGKTPAWTQYWVSPKGMSQQVSSKLAEGCFLFVLSCSEARLPAAAAARCGRTPAWTHDWVSAIGMSQQVSSKLAEGCFFGVLSCSEARLLAVHRGPPSSDDYGDCQSPCDYDDPPHGPMRRKTTRGSRGSDPCSRLVGLLVTSASLI